MADTTHECPAPGCTERVARAQLACRPHWYSIPPEIRSRVWSGFRSSDAARHNQAMADAISFLRSRAAVA